MSQKGALANNPVDFSGTHDAIDSALAANDDNLFPTARRRFSG